MPNRNNESDRRLEKTVDLPLGDTPRKSPSDPPTAGVPQQDDANQTIDVPHGNANDPTPEQTRIVRASESESTADGGHPGESEETAPQREFGDYELLAEIARGGMGVVYKARHKKLGRIVALKMILAGEFAGDQEIQRFHVEAEAAAQLEHPGIVPVFEVGEHKGQHFFSMGFVDGPPLTDAVADGPLEERQAAALVEKIADAIAHAHRHGVIHRDLKPANVLLSGEWRVGRGQSQPTKSNKTEDGPKSAHVRDSAETDGSGAPRLRDHQESLASSKRRKTTDPHSPLSTPHTSLPTPRVTDFGLAKRTDSVSDLTGTGQILGTPSYMPPEQAAGKTDEVGPLADVYSLGAILYFLLTGRPPFQAATLIDTLRQVLHEEPIAPRQLNPSVGRDMETICLKCLQKEPSRRYASAEDFRDDLRRFLANEPITARPVGALERAWRWCRRKPALAGMWATAVVLLLTLGIGGTLFAVWQRENALREAELRKQADTAKQNAEAAQRQAETAADTARAQTSLALDTLGTVIFDIQSGLENVAGAGPVRRKLLNTALERLRQIARQFADGGTADRQTLVAMTELGDVFLRVGTSEDATHHQDNSGVGTGPVQAACNVYEQAHQIAKTLAAARPNDVQAQRDLAISYRKLADVRLQMGQVTDALRLYRQSADVHQGLAADDPSDTLTQRHLASSLENLGDMSLRMGKLTESLGFYRQSFDIRQKLAAKHPASAAAQRDLAVSCEKLGDVSLQMDQVGKALDFYRQNLDITRKLAEADAGNTKMQRGLSVAFQRLGDLSRRAGQMTESLDYYRQSLDTARKLAKASPNDLLAQRDLATAHERVGMTCEEMGRLADARTSFAAMLEIKKRLAEEDPQNAVAQRELFVAYSHLGDVSRKTGRLPEAFDFYRRMNEVVKTLAAADPGDARTQRDLSFSYDRLGLISEMMQQMTEARDYYQQSLDIDKTLAAADESNAEAQRDLALSYERLGDVSMLAEQPLDAIGFYRKALDIRRKPAEANPADVPAQCALAATYGRLGDASRQIGQISEARNYYRRIVEIQQRLADADPTNGRARNDLSLACQRLGDLSLLAGQAAEALDYYQRAFDIRQKLAAARPRDAQAQRNLMLSHYKFGEYRQQMLEFPEAAEQYRQGIAVLDRMIANGQNVAQARGDREFLEDRIRAAEHAMQATGGWDNVVALAKRSPELLYYRAAIFARQRKFEQASQAAARLHEIAQASTENKPDQLYSAACAYGRCAAAVVPENGKALSEQRKKLRKQYIDRSLVCLKEAVTAGFDDMTQMRTDPDLAALHDLPQFQDLLKTPAKDTQKDSP